MNVRIAVTNLAAYTRGELVFEWLDLPATQEEIEEVYKKILRPEDEEVFITDYEAPFHIDEYQNIEKLNAVVEELDSLTTCDITTEAIIAECNNLEEAVRVLRNGNYSIMADVHDHKSLGMAIVSAGLLDDIPEHLSSYLDYEAIGIDYEIRGWHIHKDLNVAIAINW